MKKILILGAGNAQIDAIRYCKEKGYLVHGCSYTNTDKGIPLLDEFVQLDIKDTSAIIEYAAKEKIDIVYSVGSDLAVPTAMMISEKLKLPHFVSYETACICQQKHLMREALGRTFEGNVPFKTCINLEQALQYDRFPGMMKPVDSQGQRGCFRVDSPEDIRKNFAKSLDFSVQKKVIIEQYIEGPEVSANAFVVNGKIVFCIVSDRVVYDEYPGGIIKEHLVPTRYESVAEKIKQLVYKVATKLRISNGPLYMQIKIEQGCPYVLEVTPRLDGCHMWNLIKHFCNVDLLKATWDYLVEGECPDFSPVESEERMKLAFFCEQPGKPFDRSKYRYDNALYYTWYYRTGDIVKKLNGYMEKCGYQIVKCSIP